MNLILSVLILAVALITLLIILGVVNLADYVWEKLLGLVDKT